MTLTSNDLETALMRPGPVQWSICVLDGGSGPLLRAHESQVLSTASIGKLLLLLETARQLESGELSETERLAKNQDLSPGGAGFWQYLDQVSLSISDLAVLVAGVSDNLATNVLLRRITLARVTECAAALDITDVRLLDRVRSYRGADNPLRLSEGSGGGLARMLWKISNGELGSAAVSARLDRWMSTSVDTSMVGSAFNLDPLAHTGQDRGIRFRNKTGTDAGVRADAGYLSRGGRTIAYSAIANWSPEGPDCHDSALDGMRGISQYIRSLFD